MTIFKMFIFHSFLHLIPGHYSRKLLYRSWNSDDFILNLVDSGILHFKTRQSLWQNPEKGLLGQGSFPGKPGCMVGVSSPKVQGSGFHLLSRSVAPYRPPHLSKVVLLYLLALKQIYEKGNWLFSSRYIFFHKWRVKA